MFTRLLLRAPTIAGLVFIATGIFLSTVGWHWSLVFRGGLTIPAPFFGLLSLAVGTFGLVVGLRGFLRTAPVYELQRGRLEARTPSWRRAWTLYFGDFRFSVDRRSGYAFIERTRLWFLKHTEAIPLKQLERIEFKHEQLSRWDTLSIGLVVKGRSEPLPLFLFKGDEDETAHDEAARALLEDLRRVTGLGLGKALTQDEVGSWSCTSCGRPGARTRATCMYCGGPMDDQDPT